MCFLNKNFYNNICTESFWINQITMRYEVLRIKDIKRTAEELEKEKLMIIQKKDKKKQKSLVGNLYLTYYRSIMTETNNTNPDLVLMRAIGDCRLDLIKIATMNGANLNINQDLPLIYACQRKNIDIVRFLLENCHYPISSKKSAYQTAKSLGNIEVAEILAFSEQF